MDKTADALVPLFKVDFTTEQLEAAQTVSMQQHDVSFTISDHTLTLVTFHHKTLMIAMGYKMVEPETSHIAIVRCVSGMTVLIDAFLYTNPDLDVDTYFFERGCEL
jgi:hypothetical protein